MISYSTYITQAIILSTIGYITESVLVQEKLGLTDSTLLAFLQQPVYSMLTTVALCLLLGAVMFRFVEDPLRKLIYEKGVRTSLLKRMKRRLAS